MKTTLIEQKAYDVCIGLLQSHAREVLIEKDPELWEDVIGLKKLLPTELILKDKMLTNIVNFVNFV